MKVPEEITASNGAVRQNIEGNLLNVVIAVIEENTAAIENKRKYCRKIQQYSKEEKPEILQKRAVRSPKSRLLRLCLLFCFSGCVP